ncbi:MAG: YfhO family protein [Flavobacteriales bacterium]
MKLDERLLHYLVPPLLFVATLLVYFQPALEGKKIQKDDHLNSKANSQEIYEHRKKFGEEPLWTNSQFSGMPTFQMSTRFPNNLVEKVKIWLTKPYFPSSIGLIFTLFIGFFILLLVMKVDPWLALIGGFAFAFSTFFITSYGAGHTGKLRVIGFIAPCVATIYLTLRGKWILGASLTAFTVCSSLASNHLQINYYLALLIVTMMIAEGVNAYLKRKVKAFSLTAGLLLLAAILAIGPNISSIWTTLTYSKETIRGGGSPLKKEKEGSDAGGLSKDYAMRWSYGKMESFNLLIPALYGGGQSREYSLDTETAEFLKGTGMSEDRIKKMQTNRFYWGDQPFTAAPVYIGASVIFLFVLGILLVQGGTKWWVIAITALAIMMAWGKHLPGLNYFLFDYLPLYDKFRSPSMILTLVCFAVPLLGFLGVQKFIHYRKEPFVIQKLQLAFAITGGICLIFALLGPSVLDLQSERGAKRVEQLEKQKEKLQRARQQVRGKRLKRVRKRLQQVKGQEKMMKKIRSDRASMVRKSSFRSFLFIGLAFLLMTLFARGHLPKRAFFLGLGLVVGLDLILVDQRYVDWSDFSDTEDSLPTQYQMTYADKKILEAEGFMKATDGFYPGSKKTWTTPDQHYRVFNIANRNSPFNDAFTSYHHRSIGGYHAAKLIRYQDLIDEQISKRNLRVLNMLNAKWLILSPTKKQRENNIKERPQRNPNALGNAWFVDNIRWAKSAAQEMSALDSSAPVRNPIDPSRSAVVHKEFEDYFSERPDPAKAQGSRIDLTFYKANELRYKANVKGNKGHFAVFSEIYYEGGSGDWNVWIDGKKVPHIRVNYALRGLWIPPGEHKIRFEFRPPSYYQGEKIALASSIVIFVVMILGILHYYRKGEKAKALEEERAIEEDPGAGPGLGEEENE